MCSFIYCAYLHWEYDTTIQQVYLYFYIFTVMYCTAKPSSRYCLTNGLGSPTLLTASA